MINILSLFGAEPILYENIIHLEKNAPNLIIYAIPVMAILTVVEIIHSWKKNKKNYPLKETLGSTVTGLVNGGIGLILKVGLLYAAIWIYNLVPWRMELNWWTAVVCYILFDLCSYWSHRISHQNRFFWATHIIHHSAENYNLSVSFRLSWVQNIKTIFFLPIFLMGFHPIVIFVVSQISVLFQFWVHTEYIKKLPAFFEYILATPSNHRVHHGSQEKYLDKNYAATFIFWDRMFGTYQKEEERPDYGLTKKIGDRFNPIFLNFHEYKDMVIDIKNAKGFKRKMFFLFASPTDIHYEKIRMQKEEENIAA
jgi:sterol desaturase/sphingolipid hydroxylase (fatty acid hydroxylase superfamily)